MRQMVIEKSDKIKSLIKEIETIVYYDKNKQDNNDLMYFSTDSSAEKQLITKYTSTQTLYLKEANLEKCNS
jgi:hypothetical protein